MDGKDEEHQVVLERFDPEKEYDWSSFDCGYKPFNDFLVGGQMEKELERRITIPHLCFIERDGKPPLVIGYFTLASSSLEKSLYPVSNTQKRKLPYSTIPTVVISKLAVCESVQGNGVGKRLLGKAIMTAYNQSRDVACLALYLKALDGKESFYRNCGWIEIDGDHNGFVYPLKQYEEAIKQKNQKQASGSN